jgi:Domain of unknown function (DUF4411)
LGQKLCSVDAVCVNGDVSVTTNYAAMVGWVQGEAQFKSEAKAEFAQVADGWLCAYAKARSQHVVVTHEELSPDARSEFRCRMFASSSAWIMLTRLRC